MPKNEDGEFELVVGNKQLLSIVFILMVLFGVVFSMGYFLGRANTGGEAAAANPAATAQNGQGRPDAAGAPVSSSASNSNDTPLQPGQAKVPETDGSTPQTTSTTPAASNPAPAESTPPEQAQTQTPAPTPAAMPVQKPVAAPPKPVSAPTKPVERPKPAAEVAAAAEGPATGEIFLQVAAVKKPQAELLAEVLRGKGFHARISPVTPDGPLYRTLVGPLKGGSDVAKTKADLESAGFKPIVKKY